MKIEETQYERPTSLEALILLIGETHKNLRILSGGAFSPLKVDNATVLIDIQDIGADRVEREGDFLRIGAAASLQQIMDADTGMDELRVPLTLEAGANVRNSLSLLNFLRSADPRSPFLTALLALAPELEMVPSGKRILLENFPRIAPENELEFPLWMNLQLPAGFAWESIGRTPKDRPIICMAAARYKDGSLRIASGGNEDTPRIIAQNITTETLFALVQQAYESSGDDWASAEYRQEMSQVLLSRCLQRLGIDATKKEKK